MFHQVVKYCFNFNIYTKILNHVVLNYMTGEGCNGYYDREKILISKKTKEYFVLRMLTIHTKRQRKYYDHLN